MHSAILEYVLKQLSTNTELFLLDVSKLYVLEAEYTSKRFSRALL